MCYLPTCTHWAPFRTRRRGPPEERAPAPCPLALGSQGDVVCWEGQAQGTHPGSTCCSTPGCVPWTRVSTLSRPLLLCACMWRGEPTTSPDHQGAQIKQHVWPSREMSGQKHLNYIQLHRLVLKLLKLDGFGISLGSIPAPLSDPPPLFSWA